MKHFFSYSAVFALAALLLGLSGCSDDPVQENVPEMITKVTLTFTPVGGGGSTVTVNAVDPDGEGTQDLAADGPIELEDGVEYDLAITLFNGLLSPGSPGYDLTEEIEEEGDEHQFFFGFSDGAFSSPTGTGNIAPSTGTVNYRDEDANGLPIGLLTRWTAGPVQSDKNFRIVLKHLPGIKSEGVTSDEGETDMDVSFVLHISGA
ncbi:MAG: hypothetical protein KatS3mg032_2012 [Cyclobacteriaceae bacterium]|nr:MAG: hypothetical protein KatS3mg032_2012 [Cyclobacteriaceae bacterium]